MTFEVLSITMIMVLWKIEFFHSFNIYITTGNCHRLVNLTLKVINLVSKVVNNHEFSLNRPNRPLSKSN